MQRILILFAAIILNFTSAIGQTADLQNKSKTELIDFIKEAVENYGNFMGINYKVSYSLDEPNHLRIGETIEGDTKWYKIDLSQASFGSSVSILSSNKDNFVLTFKKDITIKEKNNKNATLDVMFFKKKDKHETDYSQLTQDLSMAFTFLINKCKP
jgi:glycerophosphoryl diester phosphodiesterase